MTAPRRPAPLLLLLIGLAAIAAALLFIVPWAVQAQSQEVTPTAAATGSNPPAKLTNLQASAVHDSVTLTWTASTDQTVHPLRHPSPQPGYRRISGLPRDREQRRSGDQLHRQLGIGVEHLHLPGQVGQAHRRQPVVGLRQSRDPCRAGPDAYSPTLPPLPNQSRNPLPLTSPRRTSPPRLPMAAGWH